MVPRYSRARATFPILICQAKLQASSDAWIGSHHLPARPSSAETVVVIGDTGCRIVHYGDDQQHCNDEAEWPFRAIAESAENAAGNNGKTVLIHVGDFHYREKACADDDLGCGGSPFGDNWSTWDAEFFKPAGKLLLKAPWVILRGNHENCARAGVGWTFFFALPDQDKNRKKICEDDLEPYMVRLTTGIHPLILAVLDTANADDSYGLSTRCTGLADEIKKLKITPDEKIWLALHQPLWFLTKDNKMMAISPAKSLPPECQHTALEVVRALVDPNGDFGRRVQLLLSGDTHMFQFFQGAGPQRMVQLISGNGGTTLDKFSGKDANALIDRPSSELDEASGRVLAIARYGFATLQHVDDRWLLKAHDVNGKTMAACGLPELDGAAATCTLD